MKSYLPIYPDASTIKIKWSEPFLVSEFKDDQVKNPESGYFYKLIGIYSNSYHLLYIGQSYSRFVSNRIKDADHKAKQEKFKKEHPNIKLYVSVGILTQDKLPSRKLVNDIENLLIYAHTNDSHKYIFNKKSIHFHHVQKSYQIINSGFLKDRMLSEIYYGVLSVK